MGLGSRDVVGLAEARDAAKDARAWSAKALTQSTIEDANLARSRAKPTATFKQMGGGLRQDAWRGLEAPLCAFAVVEPVGPVRHAGDRRPRLRPDRDWTRHRDHAARQGCRHQSRRTGSGRPSRRCSIAASGKVAGNSADRKLHPVRRRGGERPHEPVSFAFTGP
jgi:hypothetical protein